MGEPTTFVPQINDLHHPDVHAAASAWSEDQTLHVAACYSNPFRWRNRREICNDFRRHIERAPNVVLHFAELAYNDRPFEVTHADDPRDVQLRTRSELWHKENLLNLAIRSFPAGWRYGAIVDADFVLTRHDWSLEAIHQLQMYDWVQLFSSYTNLSGDDLGRGHQPIGFSNGFAYNYVQRGFSLPEGYREGGWRSKSSGGIPYAGIRSVGAPGGAWAFRRSAFDAVGGLLDRCILGSADWFMAFGLVGSVGHYKFVDGYTDDYRSSIRAWQERAAKLGRNVGYVDCHAIHHYHGSKQRRGYSTRDAILVGNSYSPTRDVFPDWQGVLQLSDGKPRLRDDVRRYFLSRTEDHPHVEGGR